MLAIGPKVEATNNNWSMDRIAPSSGQLDIDWDAVMSCWLEPDNLNCVLFSNVTSIFHEKIYLCAEGRV